MPAPVTFENVSVAFPDDVRYTQEHEWVSIDSDHIATVGITDFAQSSLGDITYVQLPAEGDEIKKDDPFGVVESVKAVSDLFAPLAGEVLAVNDGLTASPESVNDDAYGAGWMIRIRIAETSQFDELLDADAYDALIAAG